MVNVEDVRWWMQNDVVISQARLAPRPPRGPTTLLSQPKLGRLSVQEDQRGWLNKSRLSVHDVLMLRAMIPSLIGESTSVGRLRAGQRRSSLQ